VSRILPVILYKSLSQSAGSWTLHGNVWVDMHNLRMCVVIEARYTSYFRFVLLFPLVITVLMIYRHTRYAKKSKVCSSYQATIHSFSRLYIFTFIQTMPAMQVTFSFLFFLVLICTHCQKISWSELFCSARHSDDSGCYRSPGGNK